MTPEAILSQLLLLRQDVDVLGHQLRKQRDELATEVRTRRLVVEHESGFESIVAEVGDAEACITVTSRIEPSVSTSINALDADGQASSGLLVSGDGHALGAFGVNRRALGEPDSFCYRARLDMDEDHGPSMSLDVEGLGFSR